jgi:hypothetical protein
MECDFYRVHESRYEIRASTISTIFFFEGSGGGCAASAREERDVDQEDRLAGPPPPEALFQVEGQQPVTLAHLNE